MDNIGTKDIEEMLDFALSLFSAIQKAAEDREFTVTDLRFFVEPLRKIYAAVEGADNIPAEWNDLSDEEKERLSLFFKERFDIPDDELEQFIEKVFAFLLELSDILKWLREMQERLNKV